MVVAKLRNRNLAVYIVVLVLVYFFKSQIISSIQRKEKTILLKIFAKAELLCVLSQT